MACQIQNIQKLQSPQVQKVKFDLEESFYLILCFFSGDYSSAYLLILTLEKI